MLTVRKGLLHLQVHLKCCKTRDKQIDPSAQSKEADTTNQTGVLMLCLGPAGKPQTLLIEPLNQQILAMPGRAPARQRAAHCTLPRACAPE